MFKKIFFLLILLIIVLFNVQIGLAKDNDWPNFHGNAQRTGFSENTIPDQPKILWQLAAKDFNDNYAIGELKNPIINNSRIFISGGSVLAIDLATGKILWSYRDKNRADFYPNGQCTDTSNVYVVVNDSNNLKEMKKGSIYALEQNNSRFLWRFDTQGAISHSQPLCQGNSIYIGDDKSFVYSINSDSGQINWQTQLEAEVIHSSPAYDQGRIFIGTEGSARSSSQPSSMYALDAETGNILWRFKIDYLSGKVNLVHSTPAIWKGVVYFGSENGLFYAITADGGDLIWKKQITGSSENGLIGTSASAGIGYDKIFASTWSGKFITLDQKTGNLVWEVEYNGSGSDSSPVVADNKVCLGSHQGDFVCLNQKDGQIIWQQNFGGSSAALADNILVVVNKNAEENLSSGTPILLAFSESGNQLARRNFKSWQLLGFIFGLPIYLQIIGFAILFVLLVLLAIIIYEKRSLKIKPKGGQNV